jgi:hypothetical protein
MKQSGRVSLLALGSLVCVVIIVGLLFFSRESPSAAGTRFMIALQDHDVDTLTKMSKMDKTSEADIRKQWDFAVNTAEKYYQFAFKIEGSAQSSESTASVKVRMIHDSDHPGSYDELTELPMIKDNGEWKVDVRGLSREFYNCLPR